MKRMIGALIQNSFARPSTRLRQRWNGRRAVIRKSALALFGG
jgi:hypothetical protein